VAVATAAPHSLQNLAVSFSSVPHDPHDSPVEVISRGPTHRRSHQYRVTADQTCLSYRPSDPVYRPSDPIRPTTTLRNRHSHPASRLVTDRTVGPNRGFQPQECKGDWVPPGIPYITVCPGLPIAPD
jgi:hypothetical protein